MPSLHCHSVPRVCPAAGLSAEPRARVCPPQTQRWRSENFERPVDLEGSGDDDAFPDDELDDLYSGSGSGCEYLPFLFLVCVSCWPRPSASRAPHKADLRQQDPLQEVVWRGEARSGSPMDLKHLKGQLSWGWNQGLMASTPRTPSSPQSALCPRLQVGTQTSLRNPVFNAVPTLGGT